ncbi:hypothetical protein [Luteolibacter sp. LG18]|uniref:hypothetical protein n=1 Tax=Luteolibacter sp. LG18 TaxID=2819286 RepID=UPI002B2F0D45|nr:hypothetical protein llg_32430 [Luteolibacter sp. LG18]
MNPPDPSKYEELSIAFLEDEIDEAGRAELEALLKTDATLRSRLSRELALSQALIQMGPDHDEDTFVKNMVQHVVSIANEPEDQFVGGVVRRVNRMNRARWIAAAASIALLAAATFLLWPAPRGGANHVANLARVDDDRLGTGELIAEGHKQTLDSGLWRLQFANGATVAIEAPASFEILSANSLRIHSGKLNAWCPTSAHGFQVLTGTAKATDLGTSFGITARPDGTADYVVLDGQIEVSTPNDTRRISKGSALESDTAKNLRPLDFQPLSFSRTWPLASGIISTRGSVQPAPPGTPEQLALMESSTSVMVVPERRDVSLNSPITVDLVEPGSFPASATPASRALEATPGTRFGSYLIRYNPVKSQNEHQDFRWERFEGEVTFDRPVAAICALGSSLDASDPLFATGSWKLPAKKEYRGIDLDQPADAPDRVTLSADRRTVHILFNASISTDEVRVLLEEPSVTLP